MGNTKDILEGQEPSYHIEGKEVVSPIPARPIVSMGQTKDYELERIKAAIRTEFSEIAEKNGFESWEESNDFDVDDEFDAFENLETKYMKEEYLELPSAQDGVVEDPAKTEDPPPQQENEEPESIPTIDSGGDA